MSNKANPQTYHNNLINIISGNGDTLNPSLNPCKLELLNPETILAYEAKRIGAQYTPFNQLANKYNTSPTTVKNYYHHYVELLDNKTLTEEHIGIYLNNNNLSYPIKDLPDLPPENKLDTLLYSQHKTKQALDTYKELIQQQNQLIQTLTEQNQTLINQQSLLQEQQETITKLTNENTELRKTNRQLEQLKNKGFREVIKKIVLLEQSINQLKEPVIKYQTIEPTIIHTVKELINYIDKYSNNCDRFYKFILQINNQSDNQDQFNTYMEHNKDTIYKYLYDNITDLNSALGNLYTYNSKLKIHLNDINQQPQN